MKNTKQIRATFLLLLTAIIWGLAFVAQEVGSTKFKRGNEEGTIAIVGPKRMDYDRVLTMLEYMKENIER